MSHFIWSVMNTFLLSWARVTADLFYRFHGCSTRRLMADTNNTLYQDAWIPAKPGVTEYSIVILSFAFFYMICYLIHERIQHWIRVQKHEKRMKEFRSSVSKSEYYDDSST